MALPPKFDARSQELLLNKIRDIPSLPEVINRIIQLLGKANTPASEIANLIAYDPGLTSKVLRMVNSAAYGFQRQISSVQHAIMILGFNTVRGLVLSASIFKLFEKQGTTASLLDQREIWEHSLITAVAARILAKELRVPESDDAFSAGMLHDVGKMVLDVYFNQDYNKVLSEARGVFHGQTFSQLESRLLGTTHAEVGGFLANKWKLPISISQVIEYHHAPEKATMCQPLVYLVALANEFSVIPSLPKDESPDITLTPILMDYFQLTPNEVLRLASRIQEEFNTTEDVFEVFSVA